MLFLGSMETDRVISELCYNEVIYSRYYSKKINLGAMTWPSYNESHIVVRRVVMRLKCNVKNVSFDTFYQMSARICSFTFNV